MARALDRDRQLALMLGAVAGHAAGQDLAALGHEATQAGEVLVIDVLNLIYAELADLAAGLAAVAGISAARFLRLGK